MAGEIHLGQIFAPLPTTLNESKLWEYEHPDIGYEFERISIVAWRDFLWRNWAWPFYAAGIYLVLIFGLERYMRNRPAFDLRTPLIWWNGLLGIFSIVAFIRYFPCVARYTLQNGFYNSICSTDYNEPQIIFWGVAFAISKYIELGDTLFIVLRKRPLQVLQWYHHVATLVISWISLPYAEPVGRWFVVMNYGVHSVMYPYFALKMAGIHIPKRISNAITTAQFAQMISGFLLNALTISLKGMGFSCYRQPVCIAACITVYATFVILFGRLFMESVLKSSKQKKHAKAL